MAATHFSTSPRHLSMPWACMYMRDRQVGKARACFTCLSHLSCEALHGAAGMYRNVLQPCVSGRLGLALPTYPIPHLPAHSPIPPAHATPPTCTCPTSACTRLTSTRDPTSPALCVVCVHNHSIPLHCSIVSFTRMSHMHAPACGWDMC